MIDGGDEGEQHAAHARNRRLGMAHGGVVVGEGSGADFDHVVAEAHPARAALEEQRLTGLSLHQRVVGFPPAARRKIQRDLGRDLIQAIERAIMQVEAAGNGCDGEFAGGRG